MPASPRTRREFLADVAKGAVLASVGPGLALEFGARLAAADEAPAALSFGTLEPLVVLLQETSLDRLLGALVERMRAGTSLETLVAAGALANARTFGGDDYVGFPSMMALVPAWRMAQECPEPRRALPVLKVLRRSSARIGEVGGRAAEVLRRVDGADPAGADAAALRDAVRAKDLPRAERAFAALSAGPRPALDSLLLTVDDDVEVHRVVLPYRAMELLELTGPEHAHTLLRQSVHYCVKAERTLLPAGTAALRDAIPKVLDRHGLLAKALGTSPANDAWVERTSGAIFEGTPEEAAEVAAAALAAGTAPDTVGEAITLAANRLCLRDRGRGEKDARPPEKPVGSVHGDSIGVHAADSASAWRRLARMGDARTTATCLVLGAWQVARDRVARGGDFLHWTPHPWPEASARVTASDPSTLVRELDAAVRENDQARAAAVVGRSLERGHPPRPLFDVLLAHGVAADGALHAEKFHRTCSLEFAESRPAFRGRWLVALARVAASEAGRTAPGHEEACRLLGLPS